MLFDKYINVTKEKGSFININLDKVNSEINRIILSGTINEEQIEIAENAYLYAKQYDLRIDEYFKFVPYYFLAMNRTYLLRLQEQA